MYSNGNESETARHWKLKLRSGWQNRETGWAHANYCDTWSLLIPFGCLESAMPALNKEGTKEWLAMHKYSLAGGSS